MYFIVVEIFVLGLCYFFANMFSNKKKEDRYKEEVLLIIDDPISSFDYGNRLGVMSLLRYQFNNIKNGNSNSRILVMTHDLRSAFDLAKVRSELKGGKGNASDRKFLELVNKQLKPRQGNNEYKKTVIITVLVPKPNPNMMIDNIANDGTV